MESQTTLSSGSSDIEALISPLDSEPDVQTPATPIEPVALTSFTAIGKYHDDPNSATVIGDDPDRPPYIFHPRRGSITDSIATSLLEFRDLALEQLKRDRFIIIGVFSLICLVVFQLVFLPRSSLDRDLRRLHGEKLTFDECSRIFLSFLDTQNSAFNDIESYTHGDHSIGGIGSYMEKVFAELGVKSTVQKFELNVKLPMAFEIKINGSRIDNVQVSPFSGEASRLHAQYTYANYGELEDYKSLLKRSINVTDMVVLIRITENTCIPDIIQLAQSQGVSGVIFYNDVRDDGKTSEENGVQPYPKGFARDPNVINGVSALLENGQTPKIPVLSVPFNEARELLNNIGEIEIDIQMETKTETLGNVIGTMPGIDQGEEIVIAVEMDTFNGQGGGSNGVASMVQLTRGFSELVKVGWKPMKTIRLVCWDGTALGAENGLDVYIKSELPTDILSVVHLNGVHGSQLEIEANPLLNEVLASTSNAVEKNDVLIKAFTSKFYGDEFQLQDGVPSFTIGYSNVKDKDPVRYWGNEDDDAEWVRMIDPELKLHNKLAQFVGKFVLNLSENELIGFRLHEYVNFIAKSVDKLKVHKEYSVLLYEISKKVKKCQQRAKEFDSVLQTVQANIYKDYPWYFLSEKMRIAKMVKTSNAVLLAVDKLFVRGKPRHLLFDETGIFSEHSKLTEKEFKAELKKLNSALDSVLQIV